VVSLCVPAVNDAGLAPAERKSLTEKYSARAVALLRHAVKAGYKDVEHLEKDSDLDPLRARSDFQQLLRETKPDPKRECF